MEIPSVHTYASCSKIPTKRQDIIILHEEQKKRDMEINLTFLMSDLQLHKLNCKPNAEIGIHSYGANKISKINRIRQENGSANSQDKESKCFWVFDKPTISTMKMDKNIPLIHT